MVYAGTVLLFNNKPTGFIPTEDEGRVYVTFDYPKQLQLQGQLKCLKK